MAATLQRKSSGGIIFVTVTKIITKVNVPRNYFVITSARMVRGEGAPPRNRLGDPFALKLIPCSLDPRRGHLKDGNSSKKKELPSDSCEAPSFWRAGNTPTL